MNIKSAEMNNDLSELTINFQINVEDIIREINNIFFCLDEKSEISEEIKEQRVRLLEQALQTPEGRVAIKQALESAILGTSSTRSPNWHIVHHDTFNILKNKKEELAKQAEMAEMEENFKEAISFGVPIISKEEGI